MTRDLIDIALAAAWSGASGEPGVLQHRTPSAPLASGETGCRPGQQRRMQLTGTCEPAITWLPGRDPVHARAARRRAGVLLAGWGLGEQVSVGELVVSD